MSRAEALALFRRLGVNVDTMSQRDFRIIYFSLAKRYHPDRNPLGAELMANIKCSEGGDLELLPKFSALTVNRGRASGYIRHMEPMLEDMARSLVESGDYRVTTRLEPQAELPPAR